MANICFPHHSKGKFDSLEQALKALKRMRYGWSEYLLTKIVQYNVCYRDYLRTYGMEALIEHLTEEAPELRKDNESLAYLRDWWARKGQLADYDIQCYHINDQINILGHTFDGLEDIFGHRAIMGKEFFSGFECFTPNAINEYPDVHIGELYDNYPTFDSYDVGDDRTFQNYIFRKSPLQKMIWQRYSIHLTDAISVWYMKISQFIACLCFTITVKVIICFWQLAKSNVYEKEVYHFPSSAQFHWDW